VKERLVPLLACPDCGGGFDLEAGRREGEEIMDARLECRACRRGFPVHRGVPRLLGDDLGSEKERTAEAFGWQWRHFIELHDEYEAQFLDWIWPIERSFFEGKLVLDAGCGIGRHAFYATEYGARDVVAMDLSLAVETAFEHIGRRPNVHVVQGDIYHPPFAPTDGGGPFDFVYSIGVLHHLPDPRAGFESLLRFVRPGGSIFAWVYGHENNAVVHRFINPVRKHFTSRIPPAAVSVVAFPLAILLQAVVKGVYRPLHGTAIFERLPSRDYLHSLSRFGFRQNATIVFDHLVAPTAFYIRRDEFESWFTGNGLDGVELSWRNQNSWRGRGRVAADARVTVHDMASR
jgi:SAM-dependent methyltransferase